LNKHNSFSLIQAVYNGTFEQDDDAGFERYKTGVTMGCWGLFVYSASSAVYACESIDEKKLLSH
jgi:hypothetical protein